MTADQPDRPSLSRVGSITLRSAFTISSTGDWIYKFAVPTLILTLTGSALATAFAYVLEFIPYVIIGPFAGVIADRFSRRRVMVWCDSGSCLLALGIAGLIQLHHPPIAALYVCALVLACMRPLYFPAFQGFLVEMVSERDRPRFNSWTQATDGLLNLTGPAFGVAIVATAGASLATVLDAASFAVSASLVATIAYRRLTRARSGSPGGLAGVLRDLTAGLRIVTVCRAILAGTILLTISNLAAYLIEGNLVYLLLHVLHYRKIALGVAFSVQGLGAILGAIGAPRLLARYQTGRLLAVGLSLSATSMVIPAIAPRLAAIVAGQVLQGGGTALIVVCWFSTVQRLIPAAVIGRFVSVVRAVGYATLPAGALLGAWLIAAAADARVLFACAAGVELAVLLITLRSPLLRIDQVEPIGEVAAGLRDYSVPGALP